MNESIIKDMDFLLSIQEEWDSYQEITVQFKKEIAISEYTYHIFSDKKTGQLYYLSPRHVGGQIEGVFVEKSIVVNISKRDLNIQNNNSPFFYATGRLWIKD